MSGKNPANVAAGLKGTLARDDVSDEAKQNAQRRLDEMDTNTDGDYSSHTTNDSAEYKETSARQMYEKEEGKNEGNVRGGHKANLKNPNTSEESKEHSREYLEDLEDN
ncbi:Conidiation protein 6-domain-containing protein [Roridomyces roridus]|uniref:Conidiation protein 6-domain-containing protein n=1 Tax=Roridomyces roridus TaxID=1738132 RepID=A0AAD7F9I7_9AGAR|nr:Conidiation protein 6-domain-containing protein [Roridomyces roridus]